MELVREAVRWLAAAERPAIVAGGGTRRGRAEASLLSIAEKLSAPVVCSPGGNGAFPWNHELSLQSWVEDRYVTEVLEDADVLIVVGSSLGEVTSNYFTLEPARADHPDRRRTPRAGIQPPGAGHPRRRRPGPARPSMRR